MPALPLKRAEAGEPIDIFRNAECLPIEAADSGVTGLDAGLIAQPTAGFITGTSIEASVERRLVAVPFTDWSIPLDCF